VALTYRPKWWSKARSLTFQLDVFNLFNRRGVTEVFENAENAAGGIERKYGLPTSWQPPRSTRLAVGIEF
jgi:outer membrane receptor protein involved in Fe transport